MSKSTTQVLDSSIQIPSPPTLLNELNALLDSPEVSMKQVAALLARDAGITARLFKLSASPVFGRTKPVESVDQVIVLLGLSTVADVVRGLLLRSSFQADSPFYPWFWERSDEIAMLAVSVANERRSVIRLPTGHVQMAALFHDCGVAILAARFPKYIDYFRNGASYECLWPRLQEADAHFSTSHCVVGNLVAKHWKLPEYVCEAVRLHHDNGIEDRRVAALVATLQLAGHLHDLRTLRPSDAWEENKESALATLEMNEQDLLDMMEDLT